MEGPLSILNEDGSCPETHAELIDRKGRYAAMYAVQQASISGPEREHAVSG